MTRAELTDRHRGYLNAQDWPGLPRFVRAEVAYNGDPVGLAGYRAMLEADFRAIAAQL